MSLPFKRTRLLIPLGSALVTTVLSLLLGLLVSCNRPMLTSQDAETDVPSVASNRNFAGAALAEDSLSGSRPKVPTDKGSWVRQLLTGRPAEKPVAVSYTTGDGKQVSTIARKLRIGRGSQVNIYQHSNGNDTKQSHIDKNKAPAQSATDASLLTAATGGGDIQQANGDGNKMETTKEIPKEPVLTFWQKLQKQFANIIGNGIGAIAVVLIVALVVFLVIKFIIR